jgi:flagellin
VNVSGAKAATTYTITTAANTLTLSDGTNTTAVDITAGVAAQGSLTLNFGSMGVQISLGNAGAAITAATIDAALAGKTIRTALPAVGNSATLQTGADATAANTTTVSLLDTRLTSATAAQMIALNTRITNFATDAGGAGVTDADATNLITAIDAANDWISSQRATLGAAQNRLGYAAASLTTTSQNVSAANSQIRDVDVATETSNMSKAQILMQAGVSVLAQANQVQQLALKLLNG